MIEVKHLHAWAWDKKILKGISLDFQSGKNYCILWKNGSGKSTLSAVISWSPKYSVESGSIQITPSPSLSKRGEQSEDLLSMSPEERSAAGIFLSFQNVPEITGIKLSEYLRTIYNIHLKNKFNSPLAPLSSKEGNKKFKEISPFIFRRFIKKHLDELHISEEFLDRDLNVWFSGGEKRKIEMLQIKLIEPKYIILDEIDSGLDLDAFRQVVELLKAIDNEHNSIIIITHYFKILEYIDVDTVYVLEQWELKKQGGKDLAKEISENWFTKL